MGIRPIVSLCESPTENISQFLDFWLQPLLKALPSYSKNTTELINELKDLYVEPDTILVLKHVERHFNLITKVILQDWISLCIYVLNSVEEQYV